MSSLKVKIIQVKGPVYLFSTLVLESIIGLLCYFRYPNLLFIKFPFNFIGILLFVFGLKMLTNTVKRFNSLKTPLSKKKTPTTFIKDGVYKYTRNPIYLFMTIMVLGWAILCSNVIGLFVIVPCFWSFWNFLVIPFEENVMLKTFGDEYTEFKKKIPKWILF